MSTETVEKTNEDLPEEKPVLFGDTIDFNNLFRVKGKKELYTPASQLQKNGMVGMRSFIENQPITVHKNTLQCLGHYEFTKADGEKIKIDQVFNNLNEFPNEYLQTADDDCLMEAMVPDYDSSLFKNYHAKQVLSWYLQIKNKIEG